MVWKQGKKVIGSHHEKQAILSKSLGGFTDTEKYGKTKNKNMKIKLSKSQWEQIGKTAGWIPFPPSTYTYHINLDERGSFFADVRNSVGKTVYEIKAGNELRDGESSIFEDGFMKDKNDLSGLREYLIQIGIMKDGQQLIMKNNT